MIADMANSPFLVGIGHLMVCEDAVASPVGRRPVMATGASRPAGRQSLTVFSPLFFFLSPLYQRVPVRGVAAAAAAVIPSAIFSLSIRGLFVLFRTIAGRLATERITRIVRENCPTSRVTRARDQRSLGVASYLVATRSSICAATSTGCARISLSLYILSF